MAVSKTAQRIESDPALARYSRQVLFHEWGPDAQRRLLEARALLVGCGALGTVIADMLVRAGLGHLRIVDRDYVEKNNLQRQVLFTEQDAAEGTPKAVAAATRLLQINSEVRIEGIVADVHAGNIEKYAAGCNILLDGTDNLETRFLINDVAVKHRIPWVYGACVAAEGMVMPIIPGETPCLRCIWERPPPPGTNPTCDTVGVLAPIVQMVGALQVMEAMKILAGKAEAVTRKLIQINSWTGRFDVFDMQAALDSGDCACCRKGVFDYLSGEATGRTATLCGRDAVQIGGQEGVSLDLEALSRKIAPAAETAVTFNAYLLRFVAGGMQVTVFRDGRAIVKGTSEVDAARTIYARYVGI